MGSLAEKITDAEVEKIIREADTDGDGSLTLEEFSNLLLPSSHRPL